MNGVAGVKRFLIATALTVASLAAVSAQEIHTIGAGGIGSLVAPGNVVGLDGSPQFSFGYTASGAEYWQCFSGIVTGGAECLARNVAGTGNVNGHFVAQGNGVVDFGNNGHGTLAVAIDPGASIAQPVQFTPSTSNSTPVTVGNSVSGTNIPCGTTAGNCQAGGVPIGYHDVQIFANSAASGTWTAKANITWVQVVGCGAGGGGGAGALIASGTAASGGGAGGGGGCFNQIFRASDLGASQAVNVGAAATAPVGQTTNSTAGGNGITGGLTCFGGTTIANSLICAGGGGGGAGGQLAAGASGGGGGGAVNGNGSASTSGSGGAAAFGLAGAGSSGSNGGSGTGVSLGGGGAGSAAATGVAGTGGSSIDACPGGGAGGGVTNSPASSNGGPGGNPFKAYHGSSTVGGTSGTPTGSAISPSEIYWAGFGGGGGYGNAAGTGGTGGLGTQCGGGGGGGAALNGSTSGAGAKGGDGFMEITSW